MGINQRKSPEKANSDPVPSLKNGTGRKSVVVFGAGDVAGDRTSRDTFAAASADCIRELTVVALVVSGN